MVLTAAVLIVTREIGPYRARALLASRTPEQALLDFMRWASCPAFNW